MSDLLALSFPQITRIHLSGFTLYQRQPAVIIDVPPGVLCIAGANGIGKSTLLAAVNFALTGSVPEPRRSLTSKQGYFADAENFTAKFFDGRIAAQDQEVAEVRIDFNLGGLAWSLRRGVFDGGGLRSLTIDNSETEEMTFDGDKYSSDERQAQFERRLTAAIGLEAFEQFVFLQHFVLTFDESRDLLFWNRPALERVLRMTFGESAAEAHRADTLRREAARAGSLGRNFQWQATTLDGQLSQLREALGFGESAVEDPQRLADQYLSFISDRDELEQELSDYESSFIEATATFADAAARVVALRAAYDAAFSDEIKGMRADPAQSSVIRSLFSAHQCELCGAAGANVALSARKALDAGQCPLCAAIVNRLRPPIAFERVRSLDQQLAAATKVQEAAGATRAKRHEALARTRSRYYDTCEKIVAFESNHGALAAAARLKAGTDPSRGSESLASLQASYELMLAKRQDAYARRDRLQNELAELNATLEQRYLERRDEFANLFRTLAGDFLGIPVDVQLKKRENEAVGLEFALRDSVRRAEHMLSESQRFFVDIALRMSIARFVSRDEGPAALFVDTPEGSLDIAYETGAGEMFGSFVSLGHSIVMTANINTSNLLLALAERCTAERMTVVQMTAWVELSDVQRQHEDKFSSAFAAIEHALGKV
jgi:energy-coupling factor transporter ATP-binding protein EcfA2